eukprot:scaffold165272_cov21-Tisochrysis_lutea.AAC.1
MNYNRWCWPALCLVLRQTSEARESMCRHAGWDGGDAPVQHEVLEATVLADHGRACTPPHRVPP